MIFFHIIVVPVRKSDVREKILPANEEIRIKTNHKPKVNAKGKENNAVFLFFGKPGRVYCKMKTKYRCAVHHMSLKTCQTVRRIIQVSIQ